MMITHAWVDDCEGVDQCVLISTKDAHALIEQRDALAARLATLAEAGIVVGEDGAVRWHGMTGAEIEGMVEALRTIRTKAFEEDQDAWHYGVLEPGKPGWFWSTADAALAAAARRGADGEAGE